MFANKRIYIIKLESVLHLLFIIAIVQSCFRHTSLLPSPPCILMMPTAWKGGKELHLTHPG